MANMSWMNFAFFSLHYLFTNNLCYFSGWLISFQNNLGFFLLIPWLTGLPDPKIPVDRYLRVSQLTYSCSSRKADLSNRSYCIMPTLAWMAESWMPEPLESNPWVFVGIVARIPERPGSAKLSWILRPASPLSTNAFLLAETRHAEEKTHKIIIVTSSKYVWASEYVPRSNFGPGILGAGEIW